MPECQPIPCPPSRDVRITVEAVCDCRGHEAPGNPDCPIHGDQVREYRATVENLYQRWFDAPR